MKDCDLHTALEAARQGCSPLTGDAALAVLNASPDRLPDVLAAANAIRVARFGSRAALCSILNARSGACPEDCAFCAQSARHRTDAQTYDLLPADGIVEAYRRACGLPIGHFGVVTSGDGLNDADVERLCEAVARQPARSVQWCASLGCLTESQFARLRRAGLRRFHHNLETAESFYPAVCTTHGYRQRLETVRRARRAGLEVCSGGILGLGESPPQRVELALALAAEGVASIPLNFLVPIAGTPLEDRPVMAPLDILKAVAMFRLTNPDAEIKVCAGREHLRDLQSMIFYAGATGMMIGPLLTVAGRDVESDLQMLRDLGLAPAPAAPD